MRTRPLLAVVASCAALGAGIAVPSMANAARADTTVTITVIDRPGNDVFRGRVESPAPTCRENRLVELYFARPGDRTSLSDTDRSEDWRSWRIDIEAPSAAPGRYYVRVPATANCRATKSRGRHG